MAAAAAVDKHTLISMPVGNNPARCRFIVYHKQLEDHVTITSPADHGGMDAPEYRAINPMGKVPSLLLPSGETLYEARVISSYLVDKFADHGPSMTLATPEKRARAALINQIHDLYIASPNSSNPAVTATQGCMYKSVELIDAPSRAAKVAELYKQLGVLEGLLAGPSEGPYAVGDSPAEVDAALYPTLGCMVAFIMPRVFGWSNPMEDQARPKLNAWLQTMEALPASQRIKSEMMDALLAWEKGGRFDPIIEQVASNSQLKWCYP